MSQLSLSAILLEGHGDDGWFSIAGELTSQGNFEITLFVDQHNRKVTFFDDAEQEIVTATKKLVRFLRNNYGEVIGQSRSSSNSFTLKLAPFEKQLRRLIDAIRETLQMECRTVIVTFTHEGSTYSFSGLFTYVSGSSWGDIPGRYELDNRWTHLGEDPSPEQYETIRCLDGVRSADLIPLRGMTDHAFDIYIKYSQLDETLSAIIAVLAK